MFLSVLCMDIGLGVKVTGTVWRDGAVFADISTTNGGLEFGYRAPM